MIQYSVKRFWRAFAVAAGLLAASCAPPQSTTSQRVNVYSARHYDSDRILYDAFEQKTGIEVRVLTAGGDQLLSRLEAEGEATEADLIVAADAGNLYRIEKAGLLQGVTSAALEAAVPASLRDPDGMWWGFSRRARVIIYDKEKVKPDEVTSMDALAGPRFAGKVCVRSSSNVYNLSMLAARIAHEGPEQARAWALGVRNNLARDPQGGDSDQIRAVADGVCEVAISNHYYLVRMQRSEDPADQAVAARVGLVFPDQDGPGAHVNISGAGVSAYGPHKDAAVLLLEYLVSDEAQALLAPLNEEYPIRDGFDIPPELAALGAFKGADTPLEALGEHQAEAAEIYEAVGWR